MSGSQATMYLELLAVMAWGAFCITFVALCALVTIHIAGRIVSYFTRHH